MNEKISKDTKQAQLNCARGGAAGGRTNTLTRARTRTHLILKTGGVVGVSLLEVYGAVMGPHHPLGPPGHLRDHLMQWDNEEGE